MNGARCWDCGRLEHSTTCSQYGRTDDLCVDSEGKLVIDTRMDEVRARIRRHCFPLPRVVAGDKP